VAAVGVWLRPGDGDRVPRESQRSPHGHPVRGGSVDITATLTSRDEVTVPKEVRAALGIGDAAPCPSTSKAAGPSWNELPTVSTRPGRPGHGSVSDTSPGTMRW